MPFTTTAFPGLLIYEPNVFEDSRGYFFESYNENAFLAGGVAIKFVQDNQAKSCYGVIRGLHFQLAPHAQTKLIRALSGSILDVVVDLRHGSPTYGKVFVVLHDLFQRPKFMHADPVNQGRVVLRAILE